MPPQSPNNFDCIIFGGGLAGSVLAKRFEQNGKSTLVVDDPNLSRCSRVAAGLINPIGGKRLNLVWMADTLIPSAIAYYQSLSQELGRTFFRHRTIARIFANDGERQAWEGKFEDPDYQKWCKPLANAALPAPFNDAPDDGFAIEGGGYLDVAGLLDALCAEAKRKKARIDASFDYPEIEITEAGIKWRDCEARYAIFCEGHLATNNPWFNYAAYQPAKGVIGRIVSTVQLDDTAVLKGKFLIPRHDSTIYAGATYRWNNINDIPDESSISELDSFLNAHLGRNWDWDTLDAGVRPSTAGAYPVIGRHHDYPQIVSFNGFGSKGSMQIPYFAQALADALWNQQNLPSEVLPNRFLKKERAEPKRWRATEIARNRVLQHIEIGDTAIDATLGNGHDTLWLAQAVGDRGQVFAFDVQQKAVDEARVRLVKAKLESRVWIKKLGHEHMQEAIPSEEHSKVSAIVFNLGYLPGGDKSIITSAETTLKALDTSLGLLKPGGILSVVLYPGHKGGEREAGAVLGWFNALDPQTHAIEVVEHPLKNPDSPIPVFAIKKS